MQNLKLIKIIQEVFPKTGEDFFLAMCTTLCEFLDLDLCFVSLKEKENTDFVSTFVAYSQKEGLLKNFRYALKHTPCDDALVSDDLTMIEKGVCELYPKDDLLVDIKGESYLGHCIKRNGETIGLLVFVGLKPLLLKGEIKELFSIFTERIAAELERIEQVKKTEGLNAQLQIALKDAEEANVSKGRFIANMSHEFRTPLNAILGFGQILQEEIKDEVQRRYLLGIRESGRSLLSLINNILDFAKIEAEKLVLTGNDFDLNLFMCSLLEMFRLTADKKGVDLKLNLPASLKLVVVTDESRLRQILMNLISNALKFTEEGVVTVAIEGKSVSKDQMDLTFTVSDTGMGIPKENVKKIFSAFEQQAGQSQGMYGGTGLGLSISNKLAKIMNGELGVESEVNKGSSFSLTLHALNVMAPVKLSNLNDELIYKFKPAKILIADDIALNREVILGFLKNFPFEILTAIDGQEAVEMARTFKPDLIVTDLKMPVMDGYDATVEIKKFLDVAVIGISASGNPQEKEDFMRVTDDFMYKPVIRKDFLSKIAKQLDHDLEQIHKAELQSRELTLKQKHELQEELLALFKDFDQELDELELNGLLAYLKALRDLSKKYPEKKFIQHILDIQSSIDGFALDEINIELKRLEKYSERLLEDSV